MKNNKKKNGRGRKANKLNSRIVFFSFLFFSLTSPTPILTLLLDPLLIFFFFLFFFLIYEYGNEFVFSPTATKKVLLACSGLLDDDDDCDCLLKDLHVLLPRLFKALRDTVCSRSTQTIRLKFSGN